MACYIAHARRRDRKLVELFEVVENLFRASLAGLEAAGLQAASAQCLALGKSLEVAADERDLREIYDPSLALYLKGNIEVLGKYGRAMIGSS